jgi:regulator of protease activity HflC (stomatin/prohibitin superfamily)
MEIVANNILLVVIFLVIFFVFSGIRIANEHERFIVVALGRYVGMKGPGLLLKWPNSSFVWHRLSLSDEGKYMGDGLVKVRDVVFPAIGTESLTTGDEVQISSFSNRNITVIKKK